MIRVTIALAAAALVAAPALADHGPNEKPHAHGAKPAAADAHAGHKAMVTASTPTDGSTVTGSPKALTLSFAHPMTLQTVALTGPDGKTAAVPITRGAAAAQASVALPTLQPGAWRAAWKAAGADGHAMTGVVRFTVR